MGCCSSKEKDLGPGGRPINAWSLEKRLERTDNYNKLQNRTWYLIGNTMPDTDEDVYLSESYTWVKKGSYGYNRTY